MRARSGQLAAFYNKIFLPDWALLEPGLQDFPHACRIPRLRWKCGACRMGCHAMVRHRPPWMVLRGRFREPHVSCIAREFPVLQGPDNGVPVANLAARCVYDLGAALHGANQCVIEQMLGLRMQRGVDGNYVTELHQ
jgi:hypothetical protein